MEGDIIMRFVEVKCKNCIKRSVCKHTDSLQNLLRQIEGDSSINKFLGMNDAAPFVLSVTCEEFISDFK